MHIVAGRCGAVHLALDVAILADVAAGITLVVSVDDISLAYYRRFRLALAGDDAGLFIVLVAVGLVVRNSVAADNR